MNEFDLGEHPGYFGVFTRQQADGAFPNGSRVVKSTWEKGDDHPQGCLATVLGSLKTSDVPELTGSGISYCYFVEWDDRPGVAVCVIDTKIAAVVP